MAQTCLSSDLPGLGPSWGQHGESSGPSQAISPDLDISSVNPSVAGATPP